MKNCFLIAGSLACALGIQLCLTLGDPMGCSPPGSSVHGSLQERVLEWAATPLPGDLPNSGKKKSVCNAGDPDSILGLGRSSGEGNDIPLQYSCLENSMDREPDGLHSMGLQRDLTG